MWWEMKMEQRSIRKLLLSAPNDTLSFAWKNVVHLYILNLSNLHNLVPEGLTVLYGDLDRVVQY
jgi:hypothetical protein